MDSSETVIAAFSEDQVERLTGVSKSQLRYWDRTNFYSPSYAEDNRRLAFSRVYSFRDIVALRVLSCLRNQYSVSLQHLRDVSEKLAHLEDDRWTGVQLYVLKKRVLWVEPETGKPQEIVSKQYTVPTIELEEVVSRTKRDVHGFTKSRDGSKVGQVEKTRNVAHNATVIAGTRITVAAIKRFHEAGYSPEQIRKEYPDLEIEDIQAALKYEARRSAA